MFKSSNDGYNCDNKSTTNVNIAEILTFLNHTNGNHENCLTLKGYQDGQFEIQQKIDGKSLKFSETTVDEVILRKDAKDSPFIQINFINGSKILLTETLIGFKPETISDLDMSKLPKVVTTSDLVSVLEAIEEILNSETFNINELEVLKKVYSSVLEGGEFIGFDLSTERQWLTRVITPPQASA